MQRIPRKLSIAALGVALMLGSAVTSAKAQSLSFIRDAEIEATLKRMSTPVFRAASMAPDSIRIFIVNDKSLNAFVVARNMVFHTGLLTKLESPEELYGVIAHETAHIAAGHAVQRAGAVRQATGPVILSVILGIAAAAAGQGGAGAAIIAGGQTVAQRGFLKYTRGQESSADQAAIGYLESLPVDPKGMLTTLERLKAVEIVSLGRRDPYANTHPLSGQRIALLERRVNSSSARGYPATAEIRYWHQRMRAKLRGFLDNPVRVLSEVDRSDRSETAMIMRAVAHHRSSDLRNALREVDGLIAARPNDAYYHELRGQFLFESARPRDAVASYRRAVALAPDEPLIQVAYARALLALDEPSATQQARTALLAATRSDDLHTEAWRSLSVAEARLGNDLGASLATAEFQAQTGSFDAAERNARRVQNGSPTGSPGWIRAGDIIAAVERARRNR
jgi:predicted Zn-dependent protease